MTDESPALCPTCGEPGHKMPPTGVRPIFRGGGWTPTYYPDRKGNK